MLAGVDVINNYEDILDSRDIVARIEYLEDSDTDDLTEDEILELESLKTLAKEGEDYAGDWQYGATLIRDSYFEDYARELADSCYDVDSMGTLSGYIDWKAWARDVKMDYSSLDFDGTTYWVRD